eukprot:3804149-Amphidinium_carterae.8
MSLVSLQETDIMGAERNSFPTLLGKRVYWAEKEHHVLKALEAHAHVHSCLGLDQEAATRDAAVALLTKAKLTRSVAKMLESFDQDIPLAERREKSRVEVKRIRALGLSEKEVLPGPLYQHFLRILAMKSK